MNRHRRSLGIGVVVAGLSLALVSGAVAQDPTPAPTPAPSFVSTPGTLTLVGYTTPREAYPQSTEPLTG